MANITPPWDINMEEFHPVTGLYRRYSTTDYMDNIDVGQEIYKLLSDYIISCNEVADRSDVCKPIKKVKKVCLWEI